MSDLPPKLQELLDTLDLFPDRADRIQALIGLAEQYRPVDPSIAPKPYAEEHRVPGCESEAFCWVILSQDGTLSLHFAVENPQGISAMALAAILKQGLDGEMPDALNGVSDDIVFRIFGTELSMGKSLGLTNMVRLTKRLASQVRS